jgi:class 3 adenylate cyclase
VSYLSIKSKLLVMLLGVSAVSILIVAWLSYSSGNAALTEGVFAHLTSVRASKGYQIESYFEDVRSQVETLGEDHMIAEAMDRFRTAYAELSETPISAASDESLRSHYRMEFVPRLAANVEGTPIAESYVPVTPAARYLQYHYLADNPNPVGEKQALDDPGDDSSYSRVHARYQPTFRKLIEKFRYYDLFLIDAETGDVVYSVSKETDFATNLTTGPYRRSALAQALRSVQGNRDKGFVTVVDFAPYRPSFAAPAAFIATPIYQGSELVGVLALQLAVDRINAIMTGGRHWREDGLGESGETYLVGPDLLMRSESRFLVEDPEGYAAVLRATGTRDAEVAKILRMGSPILQQRVDTEAAREALVGKSGTRVVDDYRGVPVLSSYAPLSIPGLDWAILSEIDLAEARAPAEAFTRRILVTTGGILIGVTLLVMVLSAFFVRPVNRLISGIRAVGSGRTDILVESRSDDEFGELARSFNEMVVSVRTQSDLADERNRENENLLESILPPGIAKRIKAGEEAIADDCESATVLFSDLYGFTKLSREMKARDSVALLNDLVSAFDEAAEALGVEKIKTIGDGYMAVCGVSTPRLDHARRMVDFALEQLRIVHEFERGHGFGLDVCIGVHSGPLVAGVVGRRKFLYDVWGDTVNRASRLRGVAEPGEIRVSEEVEEKLKDLYAFEPVQGGAEGNVTWRLRRGAQASAKVENA